MSDPEQWLAFARQDAQMADLAMREGIFNQVCFHSQQCVEKSLKALIVHQGQTLPRIHKLTDLLALVSAAPLAAMASEIYLLDRFYTVTRYPGFSPLTSQTLPDRHDAEEALGGSQGFEHCNEYRNILRAIMYQLDILAQHRDALLLAEVAQRPPAPSSRSSDGNGSCMPGSR